MADREEIDALRGRVDELSGEVKHVRRELVNLARETKEAVKFLWDIIQKMDGHPTPGNVTSGIIVAEPIVPGKDTTS